MEIRDLLDPKLILTDLKGETKHDVLREAAELIASERHLSAEEIYEQVREDYPMIGLATVYKTIAMLKEMGEVVAINLHNEGARYDGSGQAPHPHFICTRCNRIFDIEDETLERLPGEVAAKTGHQISEYRLDFFGVCQNCQSG